MLLIRDIVDRIDIERDLRKVVCADFAIVEMHFIEDFEKRAAMPTVGYIAHFEYINGFEKTLYWTADQMMAHADKYSQAFSAAAYKKLLNGEIPQDELWKYSSFWYKDFDAMSKKTMLRQLISKWGIHAIRDPQR